MNPEATAAGPGIRVPAPVFYLAALAIGIALEYLLWPVPIPAAPSKYVIASIFIIVSVLIIPLVLMRFRRAATPFDARKPAAASLNRLTLPVSRNPASVLRSDPWLVETAGNGNSDHRLAIRQIGDDCLFAGCGRGKPTMTFMEVIAERR